MKYSRLTKEQFDLLNIDFSQFLASKSIDKLKWSEMKINNSLQVETLLDKFSDLVWDDILSRETYLIHLSKKQLFLFYCGKKNIEAIVLKSTKSDLDFRKSNLLSLIESDFFSDHFQMLKSKKKYYKNRKSEVFDLILKGANLDSGKLFKSIKGFLS